MEPESNKTVTERLESLIPSIEEIQSGCGTPSISFGVLQRGKVLLSHSVGSRDGNPQHPANDHSIYLLGSLSKAFVSAAIGILVDEGKMDWNDLVVQHLPTFQPVGDPQIAKEADYIDILRHTSGLGNPVVQIIGPYGAVISREHMIMDLINASHTRDENGQQRFHKTMEYGNINYVLAALTVEKLSGLCFADFVKKKMLDPLGMKETLVFKRDMAANEDRLADGHGLMEDGTWVKVPVEWTDETKTSVLAPYGIRSTVHDLLIWAAAWLSAESEFVTNGQALPDALKNASFNPLRQVQKILKPAWKLELEEPDRKPASYCLGWVRATMPSTELNWGASNARTLNDDTYKSYILGVKSPDREMLKHTGMAYNTTSALFLFPETQSAVVALSNGRRRGDASDFTAQLLIQELFDLQPRVDILARAKLEFDRGQNFRHNIVMKEWLANRDVTGLERRHDFVGDYAGGATDLSVRFNSRTEKLFLYFNDRSDKPVELEYFNVDKYSLFPTTTDQHFAGGFMDYDHYTVGLLDFRRDDAGLINGLYWTWEVESPPSWYARRVEKA